MKWRNVVAVVAGLGVLATPGCSGGSCDPSFISMAIPTALEVTADGRYAFIAATWFYRRNSCSRGKVGAALHVVDLSGPDPMAWTLDDVPALDTGYGALTTDEFIVLAGSTYFSVPVADPSTFAQVGLPGPATEVVTMDGQAFFLLPSSREILAHRQGTPDALITLASNPKGAATGFGRVFVSTTEGVYAIDPGVRSVAEQYTVCMSDGPIAALGSAAGVVLVQCVAGGLATVDLGDTSIAFLNTADEFTAVGGAEGYSRGVTSYLDGPTGMTRVFLLGTGLVGEAGVLQLEGDLVYSGSDRAFAVIGGGGQSR